MTRNLQNPTLATVTLVALLTLLLASLLPGASADTYPAGSTVAKGDADYTPWPSSQHAKASICFIDQDGDGAYDAFEPIVLDVSSTTCAGSVAPKDVRLSANGELAPGKEIKITDADAGMPLMAVGHFFRYYDAAGTGKAEKGATVYLDLMNTGGLNVDVGDLRLNAFGELAAFSFVRSGDPDLANSLTEIKAGGATAATDSVIYKAGSAFYVNVDAGVINTSDHGVEDNDVRLSDKAEMAAGGSAPAAPRASESIGRPSLSVVIDGVSPVSPSTGQAFTVTLTVTNTDEVTGSGLMETRVGDRLADARGTPTLAPGESVTLAVTVVATATGPLAVTAGDDSWDLTVIAAEGVGLSPSSEEGAGPAPATGAAMQKASVPAPALAALGVLAAVAFATRRRDA